MRCRISIMLQLRPVCENCNKSLPADSTEAMICSYECTFCRDCVNSVLENVCQNCGGGFTPRPIRPKTAWRENTNRKFQPPITTLKQNPIDRVEHAKFAAEIKHIPPEKR
jgi:hypothetical protein